MAGAIHEVSLAILRACRDKGPENAFYPRVDAARLTIDRDRLDATLDSLRLAGFLEIADWLPAKGQGYRLTDAGRQAIDRPALLSRPAPKLVLEEVGSEETDWDRGEAVRQALIDPPKPVVTPALIAINALVFIGMCFYVASHDEPVMSYVSGAASYNLPGGLSTPYTYGLGQWWRLVTFLFVHGSLIHIGFNMFALWNLSRMIEGRMGILRYLLLYLGCGVISGVAVLLLQPDPRILTIGASGAICGLFTALGTWIYMNRRHLPPQYLQAMQRSFTQNIVIMVIISVPGFGFNVSWSAHLGGAIAGILLTPPLEWLSRRSSGRQKIFGVVMLVVIAVMCVVLLESSPMARVVQR